jgi:Brp/Blh family beta-carotene 15,15'-monooxygenase
MSGLPFRRVALSPGWAACLGLIALAAGVRLAGLAVPPAVRYAPFAASVVVLGLPHGAVDHLVPARFGRPRVRGALAVGALYAALGGAYLAGWALAPAAAFVSFIALTLVHWGQGDVYALDRAGVDLGTPPRRAVVAVLRGALPMLVPLAAFPGTYRRAAATIVGLFGDPAALAPAFTPAGRAAAAGLVALLTLAALGPAAARGAPGWRLDAGETALLWVYFLVVPPVLAVGVYFTCWHSLRHVVRLAELDDGAGGTGPALRRFARDAAPLTLVSLGLLAALAWAVGAGDPRALFGAYLVLIAVLTAPHVVVVAWMDRGQGVWARDPG